MLNHFFSEPNIIWLLGPVTQRRFCKCVSHPPHQVNPSPARQCLIDFLQKAVIVHYSIKSNDGIFIDPFAQSSISLDEFCGYWILQLNLRCVASPQVVGSCPQLAMPNQLL